MQDLRPLNTCQKHFEMILLISSRWVWQWYKFFYEATAMAKAVYHKNMTKNMAYFTAPLNNMRDTKIQSSTDKCVFRYRQSNVRRLLPDSDCCRARGNQIVVHSSDNEQSSAVVVNWEDPPNIWLTAAKNAFVDRPFNFRVRMLLKSAVIYTNESSR